MTESLGQVEIVPNSNIHSAKWVPAKVKRSVRINTRISGRFSDFTSFAPGLCDSHGMALGNDQVLNVNDLQDD